VVSGTLVFLSFPFSTEPASNIGPLGWIALVPFFFVLHGRGPKAAFWFGFLTGFVTNFGGFWWINEVLRDFGHLPGIVTWPLTALNAAFQGLVFAIAAALMAKRLREGAFSIWRVAAIFTVIEWLFPMLFPWFLGNGQYRFLPAIQIAEIGGVPAVTFVMVVANGVLYQAIASRIRTGAFALRPLALPAGLVVLTLAYGVARLAMVEAEMAAAPSFKLGLVEADIGIFEKQAFGQAPHEQGRTLHRNLLKHQHMSRELADAGADIIIWPESSYFPLAEPWIKLTDDFVLALGADGALHIGDPSGTAPPRQVRPPGQPLVGLATAREDAWVAFGASGQLVTPAGTTDLPGAPTIAAAAFISRNGRRATDRAKTALDLIIVGDAGYVARVPFPEMKGGSVLVSPGSPRLRSVAGLGHDAAVAVGDGGTIWRVEAGVVTAEPSPVQTDLFAVASSAADHMLYASGAGGVLLTRGAVGDWSSIASPTTASIFTLVVDADGILWAGAADGVYARHGGAWQTVSSDPRPTLGLGGHGDALLAARTADGLATAPGIPKTPAIISLKDGWPRQIIAIGALGYAQANAFPRATRWVWQSRAPLPTLEEFDADPSGEFAGVSERDLSPVQRGFTAPILFGGMTWSLPEGATRRDMYNTAMMLDDGGRVVGTYDKVYLLAFGEYMPFGDTFPELYDMFPHSGRFSPGEDVRAFDYKGHRIGVMVCYEDILATFTNRLAREKPNIIINVTNDAWFGRTSEPHLHLALAIFRAVENRLVLVRSTNTGVSAIIEPTGEISAQTRIDDPETLLADAKLMPGGTIYSYLGHAFAWVLFLSLLLPWLIALFRRRLKARSAAARAA